MVHAWRQHGAVPSATRSTVAGVLWKDSVQNDAWEAAGRGVVESVMKGYTGCVMCYGQTGAGKTFTLTNEKPGQEGIMIQAFNHIFLTMASERELKYEVDISYQQIYLDGISDLLLPSAPVELREDPKEGVYVSGATWESATTTAEAIATLQKVCRRPPHRQHAA